MQNWETIKESGNYLSSRFLIKSRMMPEPTDYPWLKDNSKAAQFLANLIIGSSAQAYLITRSNGVWAYAGQLSEKAVHEIVQIINGNWDDQKNEELLRFVNLQSTTAEYLLYATWLINNMILALVFDYDTPFSAIRSQAISLMDTLLGKKSTTQPEQAAPSRLVEASNEAATRNEQTLTPASLSEILASSTDGEPVGEPQTELPQDSLGKDGGWRPIEEDFSIHGDEPPEVTLQVQLPEEIAEEPEIEAPQSEVYPEPVFTSPREVEEPKPVGISRPAEAESFAAPGVEAGGYRFKIETAGSVTFKPALYDYYPSYACLLIPRFNSHRLTGTLANRLAEWLPNTCIAFGWRLEYLAVRPEYLQWIVKIPSATSLDGFMNTIREQTSSKIFFEFTGLARENPSGDFWAPGYLIIGGSKPLAPEVVRDYITEIRQQQGITNFR
jgi:REP element-mobilizing transposase RayT